MSEHLIIHWSTRWKFVSEPRDKLKELVDECKEHTSPKNSKGYPFEEELLNCMNSPQGKLKKSTLEVP